MESIFQFSKEKPNTLGYYWWRGKPGEIPEMLLCYGEEPIYVCLFHRDESMPLGELLDFYPEIEFAGPVPEPEG